MDPPVLSPLRQARHRRRRDECGLTTLAWLLITAAVAGLAALAVVLVQGNVEDVAESIGGEHPRITSAELEAATITDEARGELSVVGSQNDAAAVGPVNTNYSPKCSHLSIIYQGLDLGFVWHDAVAGNARPTGAATEAACEVVK